jgi:hypothetical protein
MFYAESTHRICTPLPSQKHGPDREDSQQRHAPSNTANRITHSHDLLAPQPISDLLEKESLELLMTAETVLLRKSIFDCTVTWPKDDASCLVGTMGGSEAGCTNLSILVPVSCRAAPRYFELRCASWPAW